MYLYERDKNKIIVYSMNPNLKKVYDYRKKEIEKIEAGKRVLQLKSHEFTSALISAGNGIKDVNYIDKTGLFVEKKFPRQKEILITNIATGKNYIEEEMLEKYYNSEFVDKALFNIVGGLDKKQLKFLKYFVLCSPEFSSKTKTYVNDVIIPITKQLYLLDILIKFNKNENKCLYDELECESISDQLKLFEVSREPKLDFDLTEIKKFEKTMNLLAEQNIQKKLSKSTRFLNVIKK